MATVIRIAMRTAPIPVTVGTFEACYYGGWGDTMGVGRGWEGRAQVIYTYIYIYVYVDLYIYMYIYIYIIVLIIRTPKMEQLMLVWRSSICIHASLEQRGFNS